MSWTRSPMATFSGSTCSEKMMRSIASSAYTNGEAGGCATVGYLSITPVLSLKQYHPRKMP
jgi:hypothetical protein